MCKEGNTNDKSKKGTKAVDGGVAGLKGAMEPRETSGAGGVQQTNSCTLTLSSYHSPGIASTLWKGKNRNQLILKSSKHKINSKKSRVIE